MDHEKISNIMKWLKLNNRDGVELLRNYLPSIIEQFSKECKKAGNSKLLSELTSLIYCVLKCDKNVIQSSDIETVKNSIKELLENGFKFTSINGNESVEEILKNEKFEDVSIQLSGFINTIKIAEELDVNLTIKDIQNTIQNLNNRNLILSKLQNDYENRIGESLEKIQRGIEITQEEKEYMRKLENKYENPNANSESFFLSSFIMDLYKRQIISKDDLKSNETVMNFLRKEFKGNNHLSYIPSGYLLVDLDDISKESIFNSRLPSSNREQALITLKQKLRVPTWNHLWNI
ncbi:predicted protein [Naegleria gruberi]|uniref:Predicted protein n=1 Tax=Naegleria gruberi TaxID=5762 RepID=D2VGV5_NAEGR|nr:uncharacterized protein NAEGRDRAFT_68110 [Naegleria gruberi]EFC44128.1 predicted protein [Naegleria gruberi]|eukprot:XP_002676872.1 predicted protein [Naegleria gruberi strain NEG-M]